MKSTGKSDASLLLLICIILLCAGGLVSFFLFAKENPLEEALSGDKILNTLIVIENEDRPVTSFVLMYYPQTRRAAFFDVPGEIGQILPSVKRMDRIDSIYSRKNIQPFTTEVAQILSVDIPFSIIISGEHFIQLVDLLQGIEVFVPEGISEIDGEKITLIPPGSVRLDGQKALDLLLYKTDIEDESFLHSRRQRIMVALLKEISEKNEYLLSPGVRSYFLSLMDKNIKSSTLIELLTVISRIDTDRLNPQRVGGNYRMVSDVLMLFPFWDGALIKDIVKQALASLSQQGEGGVLERVQTVTVLNGTATNGLARRAANLLQGFGYDTSAVGNAENNDYDRTLIIDHMGNEDAVSLFANVIRCKNIRVEKRELSTSFLLDEGTDFTLILGKDFNGRYVQ